jgi:hypothetical protein
MAIIFRESFAASTNPLDYFTYQKMNSYNTNGGSPMAIVTGAFGDPAWQLNSGGDGNTIYNFTNGSTWIVGIRINHSTGISNRYTEFRWQDVNATTQLYIRLDPFAGVVSVYNGSNTLLGQSTGGVVSNGLWQYCEFQVTVDSSVGSAWVRLGGTSGTVVVNLTGVNTRASALANTALMMITSNYVNLEYQHMIFMDNTGSSPWNAPLGDIRIIGVFPTANSSVQFTANGSNSNWINASKVPPNPNFNYNTANSVNNQDTFSMNTTSQLANVTTIYEMAVTTLISKTDAGARTFENVLISNSIQSNSVAINLLASPAYFTTGYAVDPNTNSAWTHAGAISTTAGYKIAS